MTTIRKIKRDEVADAQEVVTSIMRNEFSDDLSAYSSQDIEALPESYGDLGEAFFVATNGSKVVGTVGIKREDERTALLRRIFVLPEHRGKGYGSQLIARAIEFCKEVGYQEIVFKTTSKMQAAIKLCEMKGFDEKAKLSLGGIELLKFALFLKENSPMAR